MFNVSHGYKIHRLALDLKQGLAALKPYNLTLMDIFTLQAIQLQYQPITQYELSKVMLIDTPRLNQVVKKLEKENLLYLVDASTNDRIKKTLQLSPEAKDLCHQFQQTTLGLYVDKLKRKGFSDSQISRYHSQLLEVTDVWFSCLRD